MQFKSFKNCNDDEPIEFIQSNKNILDKEENVDLMSENKSRN